MIPFVLAVSLCLWQAFEYADRPGMVLVFLSYAAANAGYIWDISNVRP